MSGEITEVLEGKGYTQALPYGGESGLTRGKKGWYRDEDVLGFMRTRREGRAVHSDGFLSFGGMTGFECECGASNLILDEGRCPKCGKDLAR